MSRSCIQPRNICDHDRDKTLTLDELTEDKLIPVEKALCGLDVLNLPDEQYKDICNGRKLRLDKDGRFLVFCKGELFGIGDSKDGCLTIKTYLREE